MFETYVSWPNVSNLTDLIRHSFPPEVDWEPPHDGDAEDGEEDGDDDVDPDEVVVALQVGDGRVPELVGVRPLPLAALNDDGIRIISG